MASQSTFQLSAEGIRVVRDKNCLLDEVSLSLKSGEVLSLIGPNGAGKSTLMAILAGEKPDAGRVSLDGQDISQMDPLALAQKRAVLPQREEDGFPMSVLEAVLIGRHPHLRGRESKHDLDLVDEALEEVGLRGFARRRLGTLSGGERQRVRIARAFVQLAPHRNDRETEGPRFLLLDEPTASLDLAQARSLYKLLYAQAEKGVGIVIIEHDLALAALAEKVAILAKGRLHAFGPPKEVLTRRALQEHFQLDAELITTPAGGLALDLAPPLREFQRA